MSRTSKPPPKINAFVFDKTGTLTTGQLAVSRLAPIGDTKPAELLLLAASAEKYSNHPTAKAWPISPARRACLWPNPRILPKPPGRGVKAQINGSSISGGARPMAEGQRHRRQLLRSPWIGRN
jgi:cation transport ATPase